MTDTTAPLDASTSPARSINPLGALLALGTLLVFLGGILTSNWFASSRLENAAERVRAVDAGLFFGGEHLTVMARDNTVLVFVAADPALSPWNDEKSIEEKLDLSLRILACERPDDGISYRLYAWLPGAKPVEASMLPFDCLAPKSYETLS